MKKKEYVIVELRNGSIYKVAGTGWLYKDGVLKIFQKYLQIAKFESVANFYIEGFVQKS